MVFGIFELRQGLRRPWSVLQRECQIFGSAKGAHNPYVSVIAVSVERGRSAINKVLDPPALGGGRHPSTPIRVQVVLGKNLIDLRLRKGFDRLAKDVETSRVIRVRQVLAP